MKPWYGWLLALIVAIASVGSSVACAAPARMPVYEQVGPRQTLWEIAQRYGMLPEGVTELMQYNHLHSTKLRVGQVIAIPPDWPELIDIYPAKFVPLDIQNHHPFNGAQIIAPDGTAYATSGLGYYEIPIQDANWPLPTSANSMMRFHYDLHFGANECVSVAPIGVKWCNGRLTYNQAAVYSDKPGGLEAYFLPSYQFKTITVTQKALTASDWAGKNPETMGFRVLYYEPIERSLLMWRIIPQVDNKGGLLLTPVYVVIEQYERTPGVLGNYRELIPSIPSPWRVLELEEGYIYK